MEVKNTPSFGMAFVRPQGIDNIRKFSRYSLMCNKVAQRGLLQLEKEQSKLSTKILYNEKDNSIVLVDKTGKIIKKYTDTRPAICTEETGRKFLYRKLIHYIFNPKAYLPANLYKAGQDAKKMERGINIKK